MPQCSKCGKEISDYGLCARCARAAKNRFGAEPIKTRRVVLCPTCGSRYCESVGVEKFRCCNCDTVFTMDDKEQQ